MKTGIILSDTLGLHYGQTVEVDERTSSDEEVFKDHCLVYEHGSNTPIFIKTKFVLMYDEVFNFLGIFIFKMK